MASPVRSRAQLQNLAVQHQYGDDNSGPVEDWRGAARYMESGGETSGTKVATRL
jgi:hypothetical protein